MSEQWLLGGETSDKIEQIQGSVLTYTTTKRKENNKMQALSTENCLVQVQENRKSFSLSARREIII